MSQPPRSNRPQERQVPSRPAGAPPRNSNSGSYRPRSVQPQRDPFPYIMGGIIGALVVGLALVIFLLTQNKGTTDNSINPPIAGNPTPAANVVNPPSGNGSVVITPVPPTASADAPPRMPIDEFKKLYDDPSKRPIIIDVRAASAYDEGHIVGAESFPEADVDARINDLPKDKLVIAYCQ